MTGLRRPSLRGPGRPEGTPPAQRHHQWLLARPHAIGWDYAGRAWDRPREDDGRPAPHYRQADRLKLFLGERTTNGQVPGYVLNEESPVRLGKASSARIE